MVHPYHGTLLSNKMKQMIDTCNNMYDSPENYVEWRKPIPKGYILYDCIYITFLKWQNYTVGEQINGCQKLRRACGGRGSKFGCKRTTCGILVVMKMPVSMSIFWLWDYSIVLQDVTIGGNWVKGTWDLSVSFLTAAYDSIIISK